MKKGFFAFASVAAAALAWGTMASAADSVLLEPAPYTPTVQLVADETVEVTPPQAEAQAPELYYYDDDASQFKFGGFIYASCYNGFWNWNYPNSLAVNQTVLFAERQLDTHRNGGFDWGYNITASLVRNTRSALTTVSTASGAQVVTVTG